MKPSAKSAAARPSPPDDTRAKKTREVVTCVPGHWATEQELAAELSKHPRTLRAGA